MKLTKKLISSVSVFAMLISMFSSLTASAAGTEIIKLVKDEEKSTATEIYVDAVTTIDASVASLTFQMDFSKVPNLVTVAPTKNEAVLTGLGGASYTASTKKAMVNDTNTNCSAVSNGSVIASYVITLSSAIEADVEILASNVIMQIDSDGDMKVDLKYNLKGTNGFELATTPSLTLKPVKADLPADRSAAVSFAADENTFVEITKGAEVKNFFLPAGVKGDATVYGLLKYTVDGTNVASGDIFTIKAVDMETKTATDVATITVE